MKDDKIFQERRARINELRAKNERMSCRERALMAVKHEEPDRVPIDAWLVPEIQKRAMDHFGCENYEELLAFLGVDFRNNYGPSYVGQSFKKHPDGTVEDLWGVKRKIVTYGKGTAHQGTYTEVAESPLEKFKKLEDIEKYDHWASADWWDYSKVKADCKVHHPKYCVINVGDRLDRTAQLKPMMYLRGIQQIFIDMAMNPKIVEVMRDRIVSYFIEYNHRVFKAADGEIDIFMMGDDIGAQTGPLLSITMATSAPSRAALGVATRVTPCGASASTLAAERFHARTDAPAAARRRAMWLPMMPVPRKPIFTRGSPPS